MSKRQKRKMQRKYQPKEKTKVKTKVKLLAPPPQPVALLPARVPDVHELLVQGRHSDRYNVDLSKSHTIIFSIEHTPTEWRDWHDKLAAAHIGAVLHRPAPEVVDPGKRLIALHVEFPIVKAKTDAAIDAKVVDDFNTGFFDSRRRREAKRRNVEKVLVNG